MAEAVKGADHTTERQAHRLFVRAAAANPTTSASPAGTQAQSISGGSREHRMQEMAAGCPVVGNPQAGAPGMSGGGCPVVGPNPSNQMAPSPNAPLPGQTKPLGTWRQQSTIPTGSPAAAAQGAGATPEPACSAAGGSGRDGTWVYPSEQMFFNAMKRKGWSPSEDDMTAVVAIHNAVNERAWREIQHWEAATGGAQECGGPRLVRFRGRPRDFSPKARLLNLMGYKLPFDRHDWVVDRCGKEVRYVIDFYNAAPLPSMPAALHLDVRPALDSPLALWERLSMQWRWVASGRWRRE